MEVIEVKMEIIFENKDIERLYTKGFCRKYKLDTEITRKFFTKMKVLVSAKDIMDLREPPSNRFEKLKGNDLYSVRVDRKYRIEFKIEFDKGSELTGKIIIVNLSKHYE